MSKFTPGPWSFTQANVGIDVAYKPITFTIGRGGFRLSDESNETDLANARLIAAAPEMYAALEMVLAIICDKEICGHFLPREIREEIEPVLARINGDA